jgi:two-component system chemotaxis response regulator CheV
MDMAEKKNLLESVDARTRLAGSNKMEILLFSLGTRETFGINVFKVREVGRTPHITRTPNMPKRGRRPDLAARQRHPRAVADFLS